MSSTDIAGGAQRHHPNRQGASALHHDLSCSTHEPDPNQPPRVAHCVTGLVRSFVEPLVYQNLRKNLIESFGGEPSLFLALKTFDMPTKNKKGHFNLTAVTDVPIEWTRERIDKQLRPAIEWLKPTVVQLRNSSDEANTLINRKCPLALHRDVKLKPHHLIYATEAGLVRLVGQMRANAECLRLIETHERRHGFCFDWISRGRPDLLHLGRMPRYNVYDPKHSEDVYMDRRDWFVLTRRQNAQGALDTLDMYMRCNRTRSDLQTPESWLRASIMERQGMWKPNNLPMGLAHPESCAKVCPPSARQERDAGGIPVFRVNKDSCEVASPEACIDDVPVTCRNMVCTLELAKLVGARRDAARLAGDANVRTGAGMSVALPPPAPLPVVAEKQVHPAVAEKQVHPAAPKPSEPHGGVKKEDQRRAKTVGSKPSSEMVGSRPSTAELVFLLVRRSPAVVVVIALLVILLELLLFLLFRLGRSLFHSRGRIAEPRAVSASAACTRPVPLPRYVAGEGRRSTTYK